MIPAEKIENSNDRNVRYENARNGDVRSGEARRGDVWIIDRGNYNDLNLKGIIKGGEPGSIVDYKISGLARYMLNPYPIEIQKRLIGCQIHYHQRSSGRLRKAFGYLLKGFRDKTAVELLVSEPGAGIPALKDPDLECHLNMINDFLKPHNAFFDRLSNLDPNELSDLIGICEDPDGSRSWLKLQGGMEEKIKYMKDFIQKDIGIMLQRAYIADGLFEMRGFDFESYDPQESYRLIKFTLEGRPKFCVLGSNNNVEYWFEDINLVHYMHLLEQTIKTNPKLYDSFKQCIRGAAKPLKLFFNTSIEIAYSKAHLPKTYREVFKTYNVGLNESDVVMDSLNHSQLGISFNFLPRSSSGEEKLFTNLSIMHDFRALEPIKDDLPQLYSEIHKRVSITEAGRFYLLDSLGGYKDE